MMIENKKTSAFTSMIENRGSYDAKQKVPDGSSSRTPQFLLSLGLCGRPLVKRMGDAPTQGVDRVGQFIKTKYLMVLR